MDAFFAAIEIRENPNLKGKPVIVGGLPDKRGVVSTCSYEARRYGIHSAMPSITAIKLCPEAIFLKPNFDLYRQVSQQIKNIFLQFTNIVQSVSIDEAYLDVTQNKLDEVSATKIARLIKQKIYEETKLTASAGVSYNKFLAKIASELDKPNGLFVITPQNAIQVLDNLAIEKFHGIGKVTAKKMKNLGIYTGKDLRKWRLNDLIRHFGKIGKFYYEVVRGIDERAVTTKSERKSYGKESTFYKDIQDKALMLNFFEKTAKRISENLKAKKLLGKTITIKIKYADFTTVTRSKTLQTYTNAYEEIFNTAKTLLLANLIENKKVRLLGITVSNFEKKQRYYQLYFNFEAV